MKGVQKINRYYDYHLLVLIVLLAVFGLVMVMSSSSYAAAKKLGDSLYYFKRQGIILAGGLVVMIVVSRLDYHRFFSLSWVAWGGAMALMILVNYTPFGVELNGKKRWFGIGGHSLFQAAELVKLAMILFLAVWITKLGKRVDRWPVMILLAVLCFPVIILVADNNLSTGIILLGILFVMLFVAARKKLRFALAAGGVAGCATAFVSFRRVLVEVGILESYQLERIEVWLDPLAYKLEGGFQVLQGLYAIGSGGIFGKGLGQSLQKLGFVPEAQNDMVFSIICEELGLFGAGAVLVLFLLMLWRFAVIAGNAPDLFGTLLVTGVMAHIAIQVILNVAVVTNTIPNTGITLPFISYGGTSVLFLLIEMGLVLSVSNQIKVCR
ncbi:MAG: cell division protein FtsW [Lachnospiraceae bacterium]|nr:cell division protein FtsW [Lachnospiraceae bacterium]